MVVLVVVGVFVEVVRSLKCDHGMFEGEVIFKDTMNSPIAGILSADYRMDGKEEGSQIYADTYIHTYIHVHTPQCIRFCF